MVFELRISSVSERNFAHPERFKDLQALSGGSFGFTVLATDRIDNKAVVIKRISLQPLRTQKELQYLLREIRILEKAMNPQIVQLRTVFMELDLHNEPISINIVMDYCGINLAEYMNGQRMDDVESLYQNGALIIYNISRGINFLQSLGIYHRDLKPQNICFDRNQPNYPVKIIDLGLSRVKAEDSASMTRAVSTICYRSPEMLFGMKYSKKLDIWSMGCILCYLMTKEHILYAPDKSRRKELRGTLRKIYNVVGKPCDGFMAHLNEERTSETFDTDLFQRLKVLVQNDTNEGIPALEQLFPTVNPEQTAQRDQAIELARGMLRWNSDDRWSIEDVMQCDFLRDIRSRSNRRGSFNTEELPPPGLCDFVQDLLRNQDQDVSFGQSDAQDVLFTHIRDKYGFDEWSQDSYPAPHLYY